jgi:2-polyprenyl-3-methyl-5-hydroxy-6-metoxy-1,4-benzoquinol methylase
MTSFLIIDDHPLFRDALGNAIRLAHTDARILEAMSTFGSRGWAQIMSATGVRRAKAAVGRRHLILDGIALAVGLLRLYGLAGPVLDIGCHLGTTPDVIARLVPNKVVGIDPVGAAIETASSRSSMMP